MPKAPRARRERPQRRALDGPPVDKMIDEDDADTKAPNESEPSMRSKPRGGISDIKKSRHT